MIGGADEAGNMATESEEDDERIGIQSVETGMRLLNALVEHALDSPPPMLKTLALRAGMHPAKAHRYMVSLVRVGLAERDPVTDRYRLGSAARHMGIRSLQGLDVVRIASGRLEAISAQVQQSVALAIWTVIGPMVVGVHDHRGRFTIGLRVGEAMPLTRSATGMIYAAWAGATSKDLVKKELATNRAKGRSPATKAELDGIIASVRANGMAQFKSESIGVSAISAPLFDYRGELVGALTSLGSPHYFDDSMSGPIAQTLMSHARQISAELGYAPGTESFGIEAMG